MTYESPMQSYMTAERKSGSTVEFKGEKSVSIVFLESLTDFAVFCTVFVYRNEKYMYYTSKRVLTERYWPRITYST